MLFNLFGHLTRPGASRENHFRRTHFYPFEFRKEGKIIPVGWTWIWRCLMNYTNSFKRGKLEKMTLISLSTNAHNEIH